MVVTFRVVRNKPSFWPNWQYEHHHCRNGVVCIDMSFMSKFLVQVCTGFDVHLAEVDDYIALCCDRAVMRACV